MGAADQDYHHPPVARPPSRLAGAPVVKWLMIINIAIHVGAVAIWGQNPNRLSPPEMIGAFTITDGLYGWQLWRLLSFQFLHAGYLHLIFNMYALYMFGPILERWWQSRAFLGFYLLTGAAGALCFVVLWAVPGLLEGISPSTPLVGASAGIFGILIGVAVIAPEGRVMLLFPPIPMKMRTFAMVIMGFGLYMILVNGHNAGGEAGHLGGALAGLLFMKVRPLRKFLLALGGRPRGASYR
ncbi:MAG: rhomboid family intramembrane serine protease [Akkermansiaceae bacterium]|nr:rhomboid family intramembrane serine protease [Akkermansiaceae bacterium]NNM30739.1 rhomboid family intramembrane serine protease [Akkermansiaceae bacterium]